MFPTWVLLVGLIGGLTILECNAQKARIPGISQVPLRVVSIKDEPYLIQTEGGNKPEAEYDGFCNNLAKYIADYLKTDYKIHLVKDGRYGTQNESVRGGWTGIIGELINDEADIAIAPLTITEARAKVVDFSMPFQDFQLSILLVKPEEDEDEFDEMLTCFHPFHYFMWLSVFFTIVGFVLMSLIIEWSFKSPETHGEGFVNFLRQDSIFRPESITGKVIRFVFMVFMIIVVGAYTASFAAQRNADSMSDISSTIDSVKDLVEESEMQSGIIRGGSTEAYLQASQDPVYKRLIDTMRNEDTMVDSYAQGLEKLRLGKGNFSFLIETPKAEYFQTLVPCDLMTARKQFGPSRGYAVATRKNSPLSDPVNWAILELKENGIMEDLINKWWSDVGCSNDDGESGDENEFDTINVSEMLGLFYFVIAGLILIIIIWILERNATSK